MTYFKNLDGLRAIAVTIVILAHSGFYFVPGGLGVELFFILSGFLITYLSLQEIKLSKFSLKTFFTKRFFRIIPPLIFVYCFFSVVNYLTLYDTQIDSDTSVFWRVLFTNYYAVSNGMAGLLDGMGILWSLCVEEHFYFIFPIFLLTVKRLSWNMKWSLSVILIGFLLWRFLAYFYLSYDQKYFYYASDMRAVFIVGGAILAAYHITRDSTPQNLTTTETISFWLAVLLLTSSYFWADTDVYRYFWRDLLHVLLLLVILRFVLIFPNYKYFGFLETKLARFLGRISYVLYLCHMAFIYLVANYIDLNPVLNFIFILALSVLFAWIVLLIIEKPSQRLRNFVLSRFV